ncbi:MAG: hypothetical protein IKK75_07100 [Clostridia bacterium]|nr:hypothetical protein [Clostridia bacterium]
MIVDCIALSVVIILVVLGVDQLLRRKKRRKRTAQEKQSLIFGVACVPAYVLMSFLGALLTIAAPDMQTQFGGLLYEAAVMTGRFIWLVSLVAITMGIVYRKNDNPQASKLAQLAAMGYIAIFSILCLAAGIL